MKQNEESYWYRKTDSEGNIEPLIAYIKDGKFYAKFLDGEDNFDEQIHMNIRNIKESRLKEITKEEFFLYLLGDKKVK